MAFSKEFKDAISQLSSQEKDKLIFRLLKKDLDLTNRLEFELISNDSVEDRREKVRNSLAVKIENCSSSYYSSGYLNMDVRYMSGEINEHVNITKDKYGEIELNLFLINEILEKNNQNILEESERKTYKFSTAVIARAYKIIILIKKMHEDYATEFNGELERLGYLIGNNHYLMNRAIYNGLNVNWLIQGEIPDDIEAHYKELRKNGYLK